MTFFTTYVYCVGLSTIRQKQTMQSPEIITHKDPDDDYVVTRPAGTSIASGGTMMDCDTTPRFAPKHAAGSHPESRVGKSIARSLFSKLGRKTKSKDTTNLELWDPERGDGVRRSDASDFRGFRPSFSDSVSKVGNIRPPQRSFDSCPAAQTNVRFCLLFDV